MYAGTGEVYNTSAPGVGPIGAERFDCSAVVMVWES
jgi:hypothetical protein